MSALADTKALLEKLIGFPTVSSDSNLDMILHLAKQLSACGGRG